MDCISNTKIEHQAIPGEHCVGAVVTGAVVTGTVVMGGAVVTGAVVTGAGVTGAVVTGTVVTGGAVVTGAVVTEGLVGEPTEQVAEPDKEDQVPVRKLSKWIELEINILPLARTILGMSIQRLIYSIKFVKLYPWRMFYKPCCQKRQHKYQWHILCRNNCPGFRKKCPRSKAYTQLRRINTNIVLY